MDRRRGDMLTVSKLIDFLKTQDPEANILYYEPNSNAYIEMFGEFPGNPVVMTMAESLEIDRKNLMGSYRGLSDMEGRVEREMEELYRYSKGKDIVLRL